MNGLGGLNKSPEGVVIGLVQLQLPVVVTRADLARQTERIVYMVGKARRNLGTMDLVVFPEYSLHGLSMDTNPEIMCRLDGPEVAAFKQACTDNKIWGCFSIMEFNPDGNPYNSGLIIDDRGELKLYYRKFHPWIPVEPWEPGNVGIPVIEGPKGARIALIILPRRHVPGDGAGVRLQGRGDHDPHRRLYRADPRQLALHQSGQCFPEPDGDSQCLHVRIGRFVRFHGRRHDRELRWQHHRPRHDRTSR